TVAYSNEGVPLWTNRYNGPGNGSDYPWAIAVDGSGNVFVTGYSTGTNAIYDYATVAYSDAGVPLWTNRYHGPGRNNDYATAIAAGIGGVVVTGSSTGTNSPFDSDCVTIKYSSAGVPLWTNRYNGLGSGDRQAGAVAVDSGGDVLVTASSIYGEGY